MYVTNMTYKTTFVLTTFLLVLTTIGSRSQDLTSPCPTVFQYRYDQQNGLYGEISIVLNPTNYLQLNIQMSIGNSVEGYNGKLELLNKNQVADRISNRQPLTYYLFFPAWKGIPPKITQILVNGNLVCSGSKIPLNLASIVTTVNLQHTLRINILPLSSSNNPPDNNLIYTRDPPPRYDPPPDEPPDNRFDYYNRPQPPPTATAEFDEYGRPRRPPTQYNPKNRFNFNPTPPPNRFNFRPQQNGEGSKSVPNAQDPAEVYKENPFFQTVSTVLVNTDSTPNPILQTASPTQRPQPTFSNNYPSSTSVDSAINFPDDVYLASKNSDQSTRPFEDVCGKAIATNHLIYDGREVPRGAFPWLVAIFNAKPNGLNYICTGSLISNRHVVTAAHCVKKDSRVDLPSELVLILGKLNIQRWTPVEGEKIVYPKSIHVHPNYVSANSDADIAVIILNEIIEFSTFILPICLWTGDTDVNQIVGHAGTVIGWGKDETGALVTDEPKQINLPVVSQEKCLASNYRFHYITSAKTFCAGFRNGSGPCSGDSGAGFIMKLGGKWRLRGIVSTALSASTSKSCDLSNYVVFCDATKYINWLLSFLK